MKFQVDGSSIETGRREGHWKCAQACVKLREWWNNPITIEDTDLQGQDVKRRGNSPHPHPSNSINVDVKSSSHLKNQHRLTTLARLGKYHRQSRITCDPRLPSARPSTSKPTFLAPKLQKCQQSKSSPPQPPSAPPAGPTSQTQATTHPKRPSHRPPANAPPAPPRSRAPTPSAPTHVSQPLSRNTSRSSIARATAMCRSISLEKAQEGEGQAGEKKIKR